MMNTKGIFKVMLVATMFAFSQQVSAQDKVKRTPEERARMQAEKMKSELALSEEQAKKIEQINLESRKKAAPYVEQRKAAKAGMKQVRKEREEQIRSVLTAEQYAKLQAKKAERKKTMKAKKHSGKHGAKHGTAKPATAPQEQK